MNYAWAIALIIIVGAAIYGLNIGNIRSSIASSGSQLDASTDTIAVTGYTWTRGDANYAMFNVSLQNNGANKVNVTTLNITEIDGVTISTGVSGCTVNAFKYPGDKVLGNECGINITHSSFITKTVGTSFTVKLKISYTDNATGNVYSPVKTLTGKVQ